MTGAAKDDRSDPRLLHNMAAERSSACGLDLAIRGRRIPDILPGARKIGPRRGDLANFNIGGRTRKVIQNTL